MLEGDFEQMLLTPQHIKAVPGRKTDTKDCDWIADLLQHGFIEGKLRASDSDPGSTRSDSLSGGLAAPKPKPKPKKTFATCFAFPSERF